MKECKHKDGWITQEDILIDEDGENMAILVICVCNHLGCNAKKKFKFDIENVLEVR